MPFTKPQLYTADDRSRFRRSLLNASRYQRGPGDRKGFKKLRSSGPNGPFMNMNTGTAGSTTGR